MWAKQSVLYNNMNSFKKINCASFNEVRQVLEKLLKSSPARQIIVFVRTYLRAQAGSNDEKNWRSKVSLDCPFKGIVSRDFDRLQMIFVNRNGVPDVPLEVYSFLNFCFHIVI